MVLCYVQEFGTVIAYTAFMLQFFALETVPIPSNSTITNLNE